MDEEQGLEKEEQGMESRPADTLEENSNENTSMEIEPPKNPLYAVGSKKLIELLLKKKILVIGIVAVCVFGFFLLILTIFSEETDLNSFRYKENATCSNVTINYVPYGSEHGSTSTMPLEQYVEGSIEAYMANLKNIPDDLFNYYYALAVAIRTEVISNGCKITVRDKRISSGGTTNASLKRAMNLSEGIVLTDKEDNLIPVKVSDFCWKENDSLDYILYQGPDLHVPYGSVDTYLNNEVYESCSCNNAGNASKPTNEEEGENSLCWAPIYEEEDYDEDGEINIIDYEWRHQDEEVGYSVLGSLEVYFKTGKDYLNLLKHFFGDVTLITTIKKEQDKVLADNSTNCSVFSLSNTTLTKEQFVSKVKNYSYSKSDWSLFQENAGLIYDIAKKNNINPELIIVRGIVEGLSPGGQSHNYFGITCYNGQPEKCSRYATFEEGITGFIQVITKYSSFEKLTQSYAYLGDYWYNPGSWADGGCAYAPYISTGNDAYVQDACSAARKGHCSASGDKSMCVATREEDKAAYGVYQSEDMIKIRQNVFNISQNSCTNSTLNYGSCVLYNQADPRWGSNALGHSNVDTLANAGCAVTSLSIALTCTGMMDDVENFSPAVLNEQLKAISNGFDDSLIYWDNPVLTSYVPNFISHGSVQIKYTEPISSKINKLKNALGDHRIPIVHLSRGHYVVLVGVNEDMETISVLDPSGGKENTIDINEVDGVRYYTF